ncbi:hypothetical protein C7271_05810 [filamentous cyanobacterium CCP5]|nr:hypothetical protein C7271_05810 [filamentous cyanobacterium CCP5]
MGWLKQLGSTGIHRRPKRRALLILGFLLALLGVWASVEVGWERPISAQPLPAASGSQVLLNGQRFDFPWQRRGDRLGIADFGIESALGFTLLPNADSDLQPVQWFSDPQQTPLDLVAWREGGYRFLDVSAISQTQGWQIQPVGAELQLSVPVGTVQNVRLGRQTWGDRIVVDLTAASAWNLTAASGEFTVVVNAASRPEIASALSSNLPSTSKPPLPGNLLQALTIVPGSQQTILRGTLPDGIQPVVTTLPRPNRLVIDIRRDDLQPRNILWAPGLRWRQQYLPVGGRSFPIYWLEIAPRQVSLRPIWSDPTTATGITPLINMAKRWQAPAAINGGFFNRNNQYPLGAIRRDRTWISGPILGRGAIAWNDQGEFVLSRLSLNQTVNTNRGQQFPIQTINSGYVKAGVSLYTPAWGLTYSPLTDGETLIKVVGNQVVDQQFPGSAGSQPVLIPTDGYLLAVRSQTSASTALAPGTQLQLSEQALPSSFEPLPQVMAAGPLLLSRGQQVLNATVEGFSTAFATQAAPRSAIGITAQGSLLVVAAHLSPTGRGPTLGEMANIMGQLGCLDALNLDGGSSSSLYLGGRLINRSPRTAARVHNGIGIFLSP